MARAFVRAFYENLGADRDIPAPDVYTNSEIMGYMLDEYERIVSRSEPGMITGKPLSLGGSLGRATATAQGGVYALEKLVEILKLDPQNCGSPCRGLEMRDITPRGSCTPPVIRLSVFLIVGARL